VERKIDRWREIERKTDRWREIEGERKKDKR
jgi:hypothetical protein